MCSCFEKHEGQESHEGHEAEAADEAQEAIENELFRLVSLHHLNCDRLMPYWNQRNEYRRNTPKKFKKNSTPKRCNRSSKSYRECNRKAWKQFKKKVSKSMKAKKVSKSMKAKKVSKSMKEWFNHGAMHKKSESMNGILIEFLCECLQLIAWCVLSQVCVPILCTTGTP